MTNEQLVAKVWNYAQVLRDQGISYGDYVEQITYLLFLKMDVEREALLREASTLPPPQWRWTQLAGADGADGDALEVQYRHTRLVLAGGRIGNHSSSGVTVAGRVGGRIHRAQAAARMAKPIRPMNETS